MAGELHAVDADAVVGTSGGGGGAAEEVLQGAEVGNDEIRFGLGELSGVVVAGQDGDGGDTCAVSGMNIMLHVADEGSLLRVERMLLHEPGYIGILVTDARMNMLEIGENPELLRLHPEGGRVHAREYKATNTPRSTESEKCRSVRQKRHLCRRVIKGAAVMVLQLLQRHSRCFLCIVGRVRQLKLRPKRCPIQRGNTVLRQHIIGSLDCQFEVIAQRAGPVKDQVAEHSGYFLWLVVLCAD